MAKDLFRSAAKKQQTLFNAWLTMNDPLAIELIGIVPEDETVLVATNQGIPVASDPGSKAGRAFQNIARRLKGEEVPFESLDGRDGFFGRITRMMKAGGEG